jgi:aryl-alcohol dehydrogenase-like predicted oxidoreductase
LKLAVGTVQFGLSYGVANQQGQVSAQEGARILQLAAQSGVDTLDTAAAYGQSEQRLGDIGVASWKVISKLPAVPEACADAEAWVHDTLARSLQLLGVPRLEGLLLHRSADVTGRHGAQIVRAMLQAKAVGLVNKLGVSIYAPEDLQDVHQRLPLELVQSPLSILDTRLRDSGLLDRLVNGGTEVHARSVFLQGLLLMPPGARPAKFARWHEVWHAWDRYLMQTQQSPLQACLRFVAGTPGIARVVVGVDTAAQLADCLAALDPLNQPPVPEHIQLTESLSTAMQHAAPQLVDPRTWNELQP